MSGLRAVFFVPIRLGYKMVGRGGVMMAKYAVNKRSTMVYGQYGEFFRRGI